MRAAQNSPPRNTLPASPTSFIGRSQELATIQQLLCTTRFSRQAEMGLRLANALSRFWFYGGHLVEGRAWIEELLAIDAGPAPDAAPRDPARLASIRARATYYAGTFALRQGHLAQAEAHSAASLAQCDALGDRQGSARPLSILALIAYQRRQFDDI